MKRNPSWILLLPFITSGCASVSFQHNNHGKFYLHSEILPTITNDKNYSEPTHIVVSGKKISLTVKF